MEVLLELLVVFPHRLDEGWAVGEWVLGEHKVANIERACLLPGSSYQVVVSLCGTSEEEGIDVGGGQGSGIVAVGGGDAGISEPNELMEGVFMVEGLCNS